MIVVIQCAATKRPHAGHLRTRDGRDVLFVANPGAAPVGGRECYARPDDVSDTGKPWRTVLSEYHAAPAGNPLGLLPAWQLYKNPAYRILADHCDQDRFYILSAGWGLVRADFLTPMYDITFSRASNVQPFKRRGKQETYEDFRLAPGVKEDIVFFGGRDYVPLFCKLTASTKVRRTVFYASNAIEAPGCTLRRFQTRSRTNWQYQCAKAWVRGSLRE